MARLSHRLGVDAVRWSWLSKLARSLKRLPRWTRVPRHWDSRAIAWHFPARKRSGLRWWS